MFKTIAMAAAFALTAVSASAVTLYSEDFEGQNSKGADRFGTDLTGVDWGLELGNAQLGRSGRYFKVSNGEFRARELFGEATWLSPIIDVSGYKDLVLTIDFRQYGNIEINDYVDVAISMNGRVTGYNVLDINGYGVGPFHISGSLNPHGLVGDHDGPSPTDFGETQLVEAISEPGDQFGLWIKFRNNDDGEVFAMDNITLTGTPVSAVPLPATGLLLIGGLAAAVATRRRR